jgi:hypothetical protein
VHTADISTKGLFDGVMTAHTVVLGWRARSFGADTSEAQRID